MTYTSSSRRYASISRLRPCNGVCSHSKSSSGHLCLVNNDNSKRNNLLKNFFYFFDILKSYTFDINFKGTNFSEYKLLWIGSKFAKISWQNKIKLLPKFLPLLLSDPNYENSLISKLQFFLNFGNKIVLKIIKPVQAIAFSSENFKWKASAVIKKLG